MDNVTAFRAAVTAFVTALSALWGWMGWLILAWIVAMVIDYLTGSAAAMRAGEWSSKAAKDGFTHKLGDIAVVLVSALLDLVIGTILAASPGTLPFDYTIFLCPVVCLWYVLTEAGSIIENAGRMGANVPQWLVKRIAALQTSVDTAIDVRPGELGGNDTQTERDEPADPDEYLRREIAGKGGGSDGNR